MSGSGHSLTKDLLHSFSSRVRSGFLPHLLPPSHRNCIFPHQHIPPGFSAQVRECWVFVVWLSVTGWHFFPSAVILGLEINLSRTAPETKTPMRALRICWFCLGILCVRKTGIYCACKKVTFTPFTATYTHLRSELNLLFFWIVFSRLLTPLEKADIGQCQSQQTHFVAKGKNSASQKKPLIPCQNGKAKQELWLAERFLFMNDLCLNYVWFFCKLLKRRVLTCLTRETGARSVKPLLGGSLTIGNPLWNGDQRGQSTEGLVG